MTRTMRGAALALLLMGSFAADGAAQTGEELYADVLGCWNCHGRRGEGGEGRPLRDTPLPLSFFLKELRLPTTTMPPFRPILATDTELALVYDWLGGADPVVVPPPLELELEPSQGTEVPGAVSLTLGVRSTSDGSLEADLPLRYRLTLLRQDASLVADQRFRWQTVEGDSAVVSTDAYGEARLGPDGGWSLSEIERDVGAAGLQTTLPPGEYVLVLEAIRVATGEQQVLGVATTVLEVD